MDIISVHAIIENHQNQSTQTIDKNIYFDLPEQALSTAIIEFALQAKISVIVQSHTIKNYQSQAIVGLHTKNNALQKLLSQSPLRYIFMDETNSYIIGPPIEDDANKTGSNFDISAQQVEEVIVTGSKYPFRYNTITSTSQAHSQISSFDSARYLNVIPQSIYEDQSPTDLVASLRNISGITPGDGMATSNDDFYIRGFQRNAVYLDGFRLGANAGIKTHISTIEHVEILKGPSSLYYGQAEAGGIVNIIRKKPTEKSKKQLSFNFGSKNARQFNLDLSGPISSKTQNHLFRFIYDRKSSDEVADLRNIRRTIMAPSYRWLINKNTSLDINYERQQADHTRDQGTIILAPDASGNGLALISVNLYEEPRQARPNFEAISDLFNAELTHYFNPQWRLSTKYFFQYEKKLGVRTELNTLLASNALLIGEDTTATTTVSGIIVPISPGTGINTGDTFYFYPANLQSIYDEFSSVDVNLLRISMEGSGEYWGLKHHLSFGFDVRKENIFSQLAVQNRPDIQRIEIHTNGDIDGIIAPNTSPGSILVRTQNLHYRDYGVFVQNSIEFNPYWNLSAGIRFSKTQGDSKASQYEQTTTLETYQNSSIQMGVNYKAFDNTSLYLNYSEAIKPNYLIDDVGTRILKPELAYQVEFGAKSLLFNGNVFATVSIFNIEKKNIAHTRFVDRQRNIVLGGKQASQGIETDFTVQVSPEISLIASASLINARIKNGENIGNHPKEVSDSTASLFVNYQAQSGRLKGINSSFGYFYVGDRFGNNENTFLLETYSTIDFRIGYTLPKTKYDMKVFLDIKNITDEDYISSAQDKLRFNRGESRLIRLGFSHHF